MIGNDNTEKLRVISKMIAEESVKLGRAQLYTQPTTSEYITLVVSSVLTGLLLGVGIGVCFAEFFF